MNIRRIIQGVALGLTLSLVLSLAGFMGDCAAIREQVLRLHILANSDSAEDQQLKLRVRDAVIAASEGLLDDVTDREQAAQTLEKALPSLEEVARQTVLDAGYDYPVKAVLVNMYFPTRVYDTLTLPAGRYDALRILIGEAEGENWWCMVFPPMCLSAAMDEDTLDDVLTPHQQEIVTEPKRYEVRFKVVEWFEQLREWLFG